MRIPQFIKNMTPIEYGLIAALVSVAAVTAIPVLAGTTERIEAHAAELQVESPVAAAVGQVTWDYGHALTLAMLAPLSDAAIFATAPIAIPAYREPWGEYGNYEDALDEARNEFDGNLDRECIKLVRHRGADETDLIAC
jgi:Flp pilus assembly pilin Flp